MRIIRNDFTFSLYAHSLFDPCQYDGEVKVVWQANDLPFDEINI